MSLEGHEYTTLDKATDDQLLAEINNRRRIVARAWTVEHALDIVSESVDCGDLSDEQKLAVAGRLLRHARSDLLDAVSRRGNEHLEEHWNENFPDIIALEMRDGPKL